MYNEFGTIVALVHIYVPFMVLTLTGVIGRIDERLEQAARSLGAGRLRAFVEVTLPLSLPGILAGSLLVFALSISAYVTPSLMGGTDVLTLPMLIAQQVGTSFNPELRGRARRHPAARSRWRSSLPTIASWRGWRASRGWHERRSEPPAVRRRPRGLSHAERRCCSPSCWLPIAIVLVFALNPTPYISFPPVGVSLRWFEKFFDSAEFMNALWLSLWVAVVRAGPVDR